MAMRVHVLASLGGDAADLRQRCKAEPEALGDWQVALASVWGLGVGAADWQLAVHSRAQRCLALRATTVDDALVSVSAFHEGRRLFAFEHRFGGLDRGYFDDLYGEAAWTEEDDDEDDEFHCPPLERSWPPDVRGRLVRQDDGDPWLLRLLAEGLCPDAARTRLAEERSEQIATACREAGATPDQDLLHRVLAGGLDLPDGDEDTEASAEVPELLAGMGLIGFRDWLVDQATEDEEDEPAEDQSTSAGHGPARPPRNRARIGCAILTAVLVCGAVFGAWIGATDGTVPGAIGGGLAGLAVSVTLLLLLVVGRIALGIMRLKKAVVGERDWDDDTEPLPLEARTRWEGLLADWQDLAAALGRSKSGGLFGALAGEGDLPQDEAGRRLVERIRTGEDMTVLAEQVGALRAEVLDAAVGGRSLGRFGERFDTLT